MVKHHPRARKTDGGKAQRLVLGPVIGCDEEEFGPNARPQQMHATSSQEPAGKQVPPTDFHSHPEPLSGGAP
ncbi:hypothetical protein FRC11_014267 [Ceratobasidium sp. 423]|nr:hypothetical protein FRC11_014267 [Ceratobasidium sp. 423]